MITVDPLSGEVRWYPNPGVGGGGGVTSVAGLTGVVGASALKTALAITASDVGAQPSDPDLDAIAALTTTAFGRGFLPLIDQAAARTYIGAGTSNFNGLFSGLNFAGSNLSSIATRNFSDLQNIPAVANPSRQTFSNANVTVSVGTTTLAQIGTMSAIRTITLPAASAYLNGTGFTLIDESGTLNASGKYFSVVRAGSDTLNGGTAAVMVIESIAYFKSDGTSKWFVGTDGDHFVDSLGRAHFKSLSIGSNPGTIESLGNFDFFGIDGTSGVTFDFTNNNNDDNNFHIKGVNSVAIGTPFGVNGRGTITLGDDDDVVLGYDLHITLPTFTASRNQSWANGDGTIALTGNASGVVDVAHGGTNAITAAAARTNLGATTVGENLFTVANPGAVRYIRIDASNGITLRTASQQLGDLGGEPALGNPGGDGYILSSTAAGVRSWISPAGGGDASTNTSASIDSELAIFSGTGGKTLKRATGSGIVKLASGVLGFGATTSDLTEGSNLYYTDARVRLNRLDQMAAPTAAVSMGSQRITNVTDPSGAQDAATKNYVDSAIAGLRKMSVRVATTANGTLASAFENGDTIDGIALATGDRILIKDQSTASQNGVYTVNASGAPTRSTDADSAAEIDGLMVVVEDGTNNAGTIWITTSEVTTLGTDAIAFTQFNKATDLVAGAALTATGLTWDVAVDNATIEVSGDALRVKDAGITLAKMANLAANSIIGNNTGSAATPIALTASQVKTLLSLNNVENTALSTWAGSTNITTLGTITAGTWNGTAIGAAYLPGSFSGFANPSVLIGMSANNGTATTAMRSDGTPAIDPAIAPTWTGLHTFKYSDAATSTVTDILTYGHNSSGTPAASFGGGFLFNLKSSTTVDRNAMRLSWYWTTATDASRASAAAIALVTGAGSLTNILYVFGSGGMSLNANSDPGAGIFNANTGFRIGNAAASGKVLRGDGSNFISATLAFSDLSGSVAAAQMPALTGDVTTSAGAVATTIANDAVSYAKMQNISATSRVLGRKTAGAGDPEELTLSDVLDLIGSAAQGDILYRGSSTWSRLGAGSAGNLLKSGGAAANPSWGVAATDFTTPSSTETMTNKRITNRVNATTSATSWTPNFDSYDVEIQTALAGAVTVNSPTYSTANQSDMRLLRIKDNGTARAITWNAIYRASSDLALPSTTVISKTLYCLFCYNSTDTKWDLLAVLNNI